MTPSWEGLGAGDWCSRLGLAQVEIHDSVESTNDLATTLIQHGRLACPALVIAEEQTAGKGRGAKSWHSPRGGGIWMSLVFGLAPEDQGGWLGTAPLRVGHAAALAIEAVAPSVGIGLKWPNDLFVAGRKLGGILCHTADDTLIVGVGINVGAPATDFPDDLRPLVTALAEHAPGVGRAPLLARIVTDVSGALRSRDPLLKPQLRHDMDARSVLLGRTVVASGTVRDDRGRLTTVDRVEGLAAGVRADGALALRAPSVGRVWLLSGSVEIVAH